MNSELVRPRVAPLLVNLLLLTATVLSTGKAADTILDWLGYPARRSPPVSHPPLHMEQRTNLEFTYTFKTNSEGLRYAQIPASKPLGERRVLVVGDSYVEGIGVESGDTFAARLEQIFSRQEPVTRFINAGLAGTGPTEYGRAAIRFAPRYQIDAVLISVFANDPSNTSPTALASVVLAPRGPKRSIVQ